MEVPSVCFPDAPSSSPEAGRADSLVCDTSRFEPRRPELTFTNTLCGEARPKAIEVTREPAEKSSPHGVCAHNVCLCMYLGGCQCVVSSLEKVPALFRVAYPVFFKNL